MSEETPTTPETPEAPTTNQTMAMDTPQENGELSSEAAREILNYDPFEHLDGGGDPEPEGGEAADVVGDQPESQETQDLQEAPEGAEVQEAPAPQEQPQIATEAQSKILQQQMDMIQKLQEQKVKTDESTEEIDPEALPEYMYNLDESLVAAFRSEDPAQTRQALQHLISQIGQNIHKQVREEYRAHTTDQVQQYVQSYVSTSKAQAEVETDFYGSYPELNNQAGRQIVAVVTQQVISEGGTDGNWSTGLRDKIGGRARGMIQSLVPAQDDSQNPQPQKAASAKKKQPQKRQAKQMAPSTRPDVTRPDSQARDVVDTLFGKGF